jgi:DNA modification methylase
LIVKILTNFVIEDIEKVKNYQIEEIRNKVILGNAFNVLRKFESEIFDMVFIDPPYFLQLPRKELRRWKVKTIVEGVDDDWDKFSSFEEYDNFIKNLLIEVKRVMKPNATIWVIGTYHNIYRKGKERIRYEKDN